MFLEEAIAAAKRGVAERMRKYPAGVLEDMAGGIKEIPDFKRAIERPAGGVRIIAEVKRSSPSAGTIRGEVDIPKLVSEYYLGGASAVSVLTSGYRFGGKMEDLSLARSATKLPLLRKDFIVEPYQVLESRAYGASAVLIIAAALQKDQIAEFIGYADELGIQALVEVHGKADLDKALQAGAGVIGINNRDLSTLRVDTGTTHELMPLVPRDAVVVSESGIKDRSEVKRLEDAGVDALLIGEALMRASDPRRKLQELLGEVNESCGSRSAESQG